MIQHRFPAAARGRRMRVIAAGAMAAALCGPTAQAAAQSSCAERFANAQRAFAQGRYEQVISELTGDRCDERLPRTERALAYEMLAKASIAELDFPAASQAVAELLRQNPDFRPAPQDLPLFAELVEEKRLGVVQSVSKFAEDWREAPATSVVITADEIQRRGYRDIEAVLHDLPGFDIARGNGDLYATIYQRGYRSHATDRTLVMVDGIEQNDLHSNVAYLSRQYPLSNIERIEVVYGPASTIYGPNAFSGVINIISKDADALIGQAGNSVFRVIAGGGSFGTVFGDATYAGRTSDKRVSWSITGRAFRSSEADLSRHPEWRYDFPDAFDRHDYQRAMTLDDKTLDRLLCASTPAPGPGSLLTNPARCSSPTPAAARVRRAVELGLAGAADPTGDGRPDLVPTSLGVAQANRLDKAMWSSMFGRPQAFEDVTEDSFVSARLTFTDFTIGVQSWRVGEGSSPWYTATARAAGGTWAPRQTAIFANYARPLGGDVSLNVWIRYKNDQVDDESELPMVASYANGYLSLLDLPDDRVGSATRMKVDQVSTQFRSEVTAAYQPSDRIRAIVGADIRDGVSQAGYFFAVDNPAFPFARTDVPQEVKATDFGAFAQGSFDWKRTLKAVFGLRFDFNDVRENERVVVALDRSAESTIAVDDFGSFFSPRAAIVARFGEGYPYLRNWLYGRVILKAMYSRASQQPSNYQRFATEPHIRELASPFLGRESAENGELSGAWEPNDRTRLEISVYQVKYSDVLYTALKIDPCCLPARTGQFHSMGAVRVRGAQLMASTTWRRYRFHANYTFTSARNREQLRDEFGDPLPAGGPFEDRAVGDIARHKANAGGTVTLRDRLDASLRLNLVARRPTGSGTTSSRNGLDVPGYAAAHAAVGYRLRRPALHLQLAIDNLFDADYWDPGVRSAEQFGFAGRIPQRGFNAYLQGTWELAAAARSAR